MATIKSYTDIEQSRKLAEILPFESADMHYCLEQRDIASGYEIGITPYTKAKSFTGKCNIIDVQPTWSLAALLDVLPFHLITNNQRYAFSMHKGLDIDGETYMLRYNVFNTNVCLCSTDYYNNPVDACVAMIEKLHELKML